MTLDVTKGEYVSGRVSGNGWRETPCDSEQQRGARPDRVRHRSRRQAGARGIATNRRRSDSFASAGRVEAPGTGAGDGEKQKNKAVEHRFLSLVE